MSLLNLDNALIRSIAEDAIKEYAKRVDLELSKLHGRCNVQNENVKRLNASFRAMKEQVKDFNEDVFLARAKVLYDEISKLEAEARAKVTMEAIKHAR